MSPLMQSDNNRVILEAILSSVGDGLIATDKNGRITIINKAAQKMLQLSPQDVIGKDFIDTVPATDTDGNLIFREKRPINTVLSSGLTFTNHAVNSYLRKDGSSFPAAVTTSPIVYEDKIIGAIVTFRDSTREKEIDAMKSDFLSVAAHQLRTPLGTMKWNLEMILGSDYGLVPKDLLPIIQQIYSANSLMIVLVNDLLDVAKIDELRVQDNPQITNVEQVIETIIAERKNDIIKKNLKVSFAPTNDDFFKINIDPKRLREAFENLISNAIKYNVQDGSINIFTEILGNYLKISFIDSGIGIPFVDLLKITNKFFRAKNAVHSNTEGTGLGLFVVKSFVEAWGGRMEISSKEGLGSTFVLYLPHEPKSHSLDRSLIFNQK